MADSAANRIETQGQHPLDAPAFTVGREDLVTAARSLRTIARELTAAAARVKAAAPANPAFGELPSGERMPLEEWADVALLGVARHFHHQARQAIHEARAERRSKARAKALRVVRAK
jgi:hypothetical protein